MRKGQSGTPSAAGTSSRYQKVPSPFNGKKGVAVSKVSTPVAANSEHCTGCGRHGHIAKTCLLKSHPDYNSDEKNRMEKLGEREAMGCTPTRLHRATFQGDVGGKFDVQEADNSSEKDDR